MNGPFWGEPSQRVDLKRAFENGERRDAVIFDEPPVESVARDHGVELCDRELVTKVGGESNK